MSMLRQSQEDKASRVQKMFSTIAPRYDVLNSILSFGVDRLWRREATRKAIENKPQRILDVATGTADLAISLKRSCPEADVIGVDFAEPMLERGRTKASKAGVAIELRHGDGLNLPFEDESFDTLTISYGLRNFADYAGGLAEFYRVLKPGGRVVIAEFPPPSQNLYGRLFRFYFLGVCPRIGGLISGNRAAYDYLPQSVLNFPKPEVLASMLEEAGFCKVHYRLQLMGVSALHVGERG